MLTFSLSNSSTTCLNLTCFRFKIMLVTSSFVKVPYKDRELSIAIVSGLKNAENLIQAIQAGEVEYDFVEVMACEGGCIAGAGQPFVIGRAKPERSEGMYQADRMSNVKLSAENPVTDGLYANLLAGDKAHHLLHYK